MSEKTITIHSKDGDVTLRIPEGQQIESGVLAYYNEKCAKELLQVYTRVIESGESLFISSDATKLTPNTLRVKYYNSLKYGNLAGLITEEMRSKVSMRQESNGILIYPSRNAEDISFIDVVESVDLLVLEKLEWFKTTCKPGDLLIWKFKLPPTLYVKVKKFVASLEGFVWILNHNSIRLFKS